MNTESTKQSCPKCGASIPPEAPQGLCPKCVMSGVATEAGAGIPDLTAGDVPSIERVSGAFPNLDEIELVGRGGMGFVFKARQPHLERYVALKLLPDKLAADPHFAERFNREGRVLAKLNHPNIVSVYDFGKTDQFYFLMMEYVDGVNLRQAMRAGRFSPAEALAVVPNICEALQYAHDRGVLHRDIKPENILLDTEGRAKIADFGIAKLVGEDAAANVTLTMTGSSLGTPHYMAPEQLEKPSDVDHRADIYSLGVVLYELLTGELPIGRFEAPSAKTPVGKGVDDVVFRALEKNREKRQHSAEEFKTQVESAGTGEVPPPLDSGSTAKPVKPGISIPGVIGATLVGLSLFLMIAGGLLMVRTRNGLAIFELLIIGFPVGLSALIGTVLGWVGLAQIRRSDGAKYGTPLALFAAVAYPFGLPALIVVGLPLLTAFPAGSGPSWFARIIIIMLISGLLSALIWGIVAIGRWARNEPTGRHWSMRGWAITSGAMFLVMLLITLSASGGGQTVTRQRPAQITQIREADRLPDDAVELLAISRHPSDGVWWRPDGTAWTNAPFENPGHNASANKEQHAVELVFRIPPHWKTNALKKFQLHGVKGSSGGGSPIQSGQPMKDGYFTAAVFPKDMVSTTISVGIGDQRDWKTVAQTGTAMPYHVGVNYRGESVTVKFLSATEDKNGDVVVTTAHDLAIKEYRVVAVNLAGKLVRAQEANWSDGEMTSKFAGTSLDEISAFSLQVLPFRWAVFEDVWLMPRDTGSETSGLSQPGVRVNFGNVDLVTKNGQDRLELSYTTTANRAHLTWGTSGAFDEGPIDLVDSTSVTEQPNGAPAIIQHKASLLVPSSLDKSVVIRALRATREKWNGQSLVVLPEDKHTVMSIEHSPGEFVALTLGSKTKDP